MPRMRNDGGDPYEIGRCAGCGHAIMSDDDYFISGEDMIHAEGVGAVAKVPGKAKAINMSCLFLYLQREHMTPNQDSQYTEKPKKASSLSK